MNASRTALVAAGGVALALAGRALWSRARALDLDGRVVLVTGGSRGLGLALAERFAAEGARLVICARHEADLERARARLASRGVEVLAHACDVSDRAAVRELVGAALDRFGRIDVLVNNAGEIAAGPVEAQTVEDFERAMATMFFGVVHPTLAVLPQMRERREGRIVNVTSIGGKVAIPHLLPYDSAKFAAVGFSEGLRAELAKDGIAVVTVVPGLMRTGSYLGAGFKGNARAEFTWFALTGNSPLTSIGAERAARKIVAATRRGDAEIVLSSQAKLLRLFHGVAPGLTADVLGLVNRVLPDAAGPSGPPVEGRKARTPLSESPLTALGRAAARRYQWAD
jgi:NAD(P)-dependent dehydrogenase (short-subunit alcohol dehydrogenase family)